MYQQHSSGSGKKDLRYGDLDAGGLLRSLLRNGICETRAGSTTRQLKKLSYNVVALTASDDPTVEAGVILQRFLKLRQSLQAL